MSLIADREKPLKLVKRLSETQLCGLVVMLKAKRPLPAYMIFPSKVGGTGPNLDGLIRRGLVAKFTTVDGGNRGKGGRIDVFRLTADGIATAISEVLRKAEEPKA
jgi:hypothetical protein